MPAAGRGLGGGDVRAEENRKIIGPIGGIGADGDPVADGPYAFSMIEAANNEFRSVTGSLRV